MTIPISGNDRDGTFLRLLFRRVGNDDAALFDFLLFERLNQHAIAERSHIGCHIALYPSFKLMKIIPCTETLIEGSPDDENPDAVSDAAPILSFQLIRTLPRHFGR